VTATIDVPQLHIRMPDTTRSTVQQLTPAKGVRVGMRLSDGTWSKIGADVAAEPPPRVGKPVRVVVRFGDDVEIRRGTMLRVALRGGPTIEYADRLKVSGQLHLASGTLDVEGKRFVFDQGTVSFVGDDPTNPTLAVTAVWDAGDGTRVYADFIGPLRSGKLTLRSEPALTENEILALVLFGTTDGLQGQGASSADPSTAAFGAGAGVGAGLATEGVNKAISQLTTIDISTRVDTAHETPRPEIVVQLTKNISAQFAYVLGTPPVGQNPDQTLLTIDWRFLGKWSLETTVGDAGSSIVDVLWMHRY
jgi:translocation and assembly module TamB